MLRRHSEQMTKAGSSWCEGPALQTSHPIGAQLHQRGLTRACFIEIWHITVGDVRTAALFFGVFHCFADIIALELLCLQERGKNR